MIQFSRAGNGASRALALAVVGWVASTPMAAEAGPRDWAVVSGAARFQVLTPRLIRTEYAGHQQFQDAGTFNVVGREGFTRPDFRTSSANGWLTITTSDMVLSYREGSGPFNADNLILSWPAGTPLRAAPWQRVECRLDRLCEAELLSKTGVGTAREHAGFTGDGFVAGFAAVNDGVTAEVNVPAAGTYAFQVRYANGVGGDGQHTSRSLTVATASGAASALALPATANWGNWAVAQVPLALNAGRNTVRLYRAADNSGNVNVDSMAVVAQGAPFPPASSRQALDCTFGTVCEAEAAAFDGTVVIQSNHTGHAGRGFVAEFNPGSSVSARITGVPADGAYQLQVRYANSTGGDGLNQARTVRVTAQGQDRTLSLPTTADWDTWRTEAVTVALKAGDNEVTLTCPDAASCRVNLDTLAVASAGSPMLMPHLPLGGYRRSLDNIDGVAPLSPGLLHRDGWYLLDDTVSALFEPSTDRLTARPSPGAQAYLDGYVFAFGHDYKRALGDLARLTGPSLLLPRWAYGVWYSQYYDRTAADFQQTIVPRFRAEGVPLDVLVVDTDFKAGDTWSGWSIDRRKFPDPKGFFDWARAEGLTAPFNVHPSIVGNDPQFAQAQATARGKLKRTYCGGSAASNPAGCYGFDWADPDQLAAYFGLHGEMEQQGVELWWLDWCCDGSTATRRDVTPDAYINHQYARRVSRMIGRGFAFSRAFGSGPGNNLPNEPTGPWADKRSTVHFTGDTSTTWRMLAAEVGYTAAESAATGIVAVSHDIGGHNNVGDQAPGAEPGTTRMADDMYARWVQFGTFQPIQRLHSNHGDRLPWQYGAAAKASATRFLRLRQALVPTTYSLAWSANRTGVPLVRAMYLEHPQDEAAHAAAGAQYYYGPDLLVAPAVTPGMTTSTAVWLPPGRWTDLFSGTTYTGNRTQTVTTDLNAMPVFLRAGGLLVTRSDEAPSDRLRPMKALTVTAATGAPGRFTLYEDDGQSPAPAPSATTSIAYEASAAGHMLVIQPALGGGFRGQVTARSWTAVFLNADAPATVWVDGRVVPPGAWRYEAASRKLTVPVPERSVARPTVVAYR